MNLKELCSIVESVLFVSGEEISFEEMIKLINNVRESKEVDKKKLEEAAILLQERYKDKKSGLTLLLTKDSMQLATVPENHKYIETMTVKKKKKNLTQSAMETLSIIAYCQPVTKVEIEEIRGVKSDYPLKVLLDYQLIEEAGRLDKIGKPILYRTTREFLLHFNLKDIKELPQFENFVQITQEETLFDMANEIQGKMEEEK